jgi:hypothetical protein
VGTIFAFVTFNLKMLHFLFFAEVFGTISVEYENQWSFFSQYFFLNKYRPENPRLTLI